MKITSLGFKKPDGDDLIDIQDFNDNADIMDEELLMRPLKTGAASDMTNTFSQAGSLTNLISGEAQKFSFGKIMTAIADYISHKAATATASVFGHVRLTDDCTKISNGTAGVAASSKAVNDIYKEMDAWIGFNSQVPAGKNINECLNILVGNYNRYSYVDMGEITTIANSVKSITVDISGAGHAAMLGKPKITIPSIMYTGSNAYAQITTWSSDPGPNDTSFTLRVAADRVIKVRIFIRIFWCG